MATKKTSLRDVQQDLVERIKGAADQSSSGARLGVQAGAANFLLHLEEAGEVLPLPQVTSVPLTKPWFLGLANIRGNLHSVIDLSLFIGGEPTPRRADAPRERQQGEQPEQEHRDRTADQAGAHQPGCQGSAHHHGGQRGNPARPGAAIAPAKKIRHRIKIQAAQVGRDQQADKTEAASPAQHISQASGLCFRACKALQVKSASQTDEGRSTHPVCRRRHAVVDRRHAPACQVILFDVRCPAVQANRCVKPYGGKQKACADPLP